MTDQLNRQEENPMEMKHFPTINLEATGKHIAQLRKERGLSVKDVQNYFGFDAPQAIYKSHVLSRGKMEFFSRFLKKN